MIPTIISHAIAFALGQISCLITLAFLHGRRRGKGDR